MNNGFAALSQGFSTQSTSAGEALYYEESATGSGSNESVVVRGNEVYCPSCELMHPQTTLNGIARGSRVAWQGHPADVLSVYAQPGSGVVRACIMLDGRAAAYDRQGLPASELVLI